MFRRWLFVRCRTIKRTHLIYSVYVKPELPNLPLDLPQKIFMDDCVGCLRFAHGLLRKRFHLFYLFRPRQYIFQQLTHLVLIQFRHSILNEDISFATSFRI